MRHEGTYDQQADRPIRRWSRFLVCRRRACRRRGQRGCLGSNGASLVHFDLDSPGGATSAPPNGAGARLDAIDFRPATKELCGCDARLEAYCRVDPGTVRLTRIDGRMVLPSGGAAVDTDWNPTTDRQRTISSNGDNIVFNPVNGGTARAIDLLCRSGDRNAAAIPFVVGNACTNSLAENFGGTTVQFVLDARGNTLARLANNLGEMQSVARLTLNGAPFALPESAGFDIFFDRKTSANVAYVPARSDRLTSLFTVDLATGVLTPDIRRIRTCYWRTQRPRDWPRGLTSGALMRSRPQRR